MLNFASRARPYLGAVVLTTALLTAGGIYSAMKMPSGVYPEVNFSRIGVVARVPSLPVPNMQVQVTRPIEEAVTTVIGVAQVRSKTIRGGSEIYIDFNPGTNMIRAEQQTWNRIGSVRSQLPLDTDLVVEQMTPSIFPIISVVLTGGDSPSKLRDYAYYQLAPRLKTVPDVLYANVAGGDFREIEVEARPTDLLAAGLSAADLADQINKVHRIQPVGKSERPPLAFQMMVNTQGTTARDIEELVVGTKNNQPLRVRDVADVHVLHADRTQSIGFEGKDAVVISIFRRLGGNTLNVSRDVRALLKRQPLPRNIKATVVYDQAGFVSDSVDNVRDAIIVGGFFSILILLLFLRSWRATLISALAIPTTLAITFLFLHWSGETLNLMSLGGLAVAIGLIIDDTVVVIENIARHLEAKKTAGSSSHEPLPAAGTTNGPPSHAPAGIHIPPAVDPVDAASSEITGAVVGSTLTTVLVFVPLAFIVGVYGQFFAALSWSLCIAVLVSMVISLTVVPVFAAKFLAGRPMPPPGPIYRFLAHLYELALGVALRFPRTTLALSVAAVLAGVILYTGIPDVRTDSGGWADKQITKVLESRHITDTRTKLKPGEPPPPPLFPGLETGLMPAMDEGAFIFDYWAPSGTPLARTEAMARDVEDVLSANPDVDTYVRRTGAENGIFATQTNRGDIQVVLRPAENDPVSLVTKPVRPPFQKIEKEMTQLGKTRAEQKHGPKFTPEQAREEGKEAIRERYRRRSVLEVMEEVEDEVKDKYHEHQFKVDLVQIMQDELNDLSGASKPIEVKFLGPDYTKLRKLASDLGETLEKKGKGRGFKEPMSNVFQGNPDLMIQVDPVKATHFNLKADEVERQLKAIYLGQISTQVRESAARITDVRVRYPDWARFGRNNFDPDQILNQLILLPEGTALPPALSEPQPPRVLAGMLRAVPLATVARIERVRTPEEQWRENQQPAIFVTSEQNEKEAGLGSMVADVQRWIGEMQLPAGYRAEIGGHYLRQQDAFYSLGAVMIVAVFLVFIMLAFQFRSVVLPLLIFLTQPLSLVSGMFALWLTHTPLNVSSAMGAILLVGLDMKNGILLVEYIQQLRAEGMELRPALILAGRTRFRPILMTSLAAILGLFPLALGIGPGAQMQQPLAIMVIGGLTANMLFTRMVIPVGYLVLERRKPAKPARVPATAPAPVPVAAVPTAT
jgi:multidrug efflux pump subunit AcrB